MSALTRVVSGSAAAGLAAAGVSTYNKNSGAQADKRGSPITASVKPGHEDAGLKTGNQRRLPSEFFHLKIGSAVDWRNGGKDH